MENVPNDINKQFDVKPKGISKLLSKAQPVGGRALEDGGDDYYVKNGHIAGYSIQFQGCHHIQQWNDDAGDEDVRLQTKRMIRFRLVPTPKCTVVSPWASAKVIRDAASAFGNVDYGEYIVDLNTFVTSYLEAEQQESEDLCEDYQETCQAACANDDDGTYKACMKNCYQNYGCWSKDEDDDNDDGLDMDVYDYAGCAQFDWDTDDDNDDNYDYYFGPSCADQGGEIRMNLFTDDTCTTLARCGNNGSTRGSSCYTRTTGYILPGTKENIIKHPCLSCTSNYLTLDESINALKEGESFDYSNFDYGEPRDVCSNIYDVSGKCEKNMENGQYNNACKYLQGIQIGVSKEGYAVAVRRSVVADAALFTLVLASLVMGFYISHMKGKLKM